MTEEQTFHKYSKIKVFGHEDNVEMFSEPSDEIIVEEKIDGANFRFMVKDGRIIFGSRNTALGDEEQEIGGNWKACINYVKKNINREELNSGSYIVYGECCVKHSINYNWEEMPPFLGFDIFDLEQKKFISYDEKVELFNRLNLPVVPLIKRTTAKEFIDKAPSDDDVPKSAYYEGPAEGIVLKNYNKGTFSKYVTDQFKEVNREVFGGSRKHALDDSERIVYTYCTNARIEKMIFKLLHEGEKLDMPLMHKLPKRVYDDMWEENLTDIYTKDWTINFRKVWRMVSKRCFNVLKTTITNNKRNEL